MRAVLQRVRSGSVTVDGEVAGKIGKGLVILLGVGKEDTPQDCSLLAEKIANLRIFEDSEGKMNLSLLDVGGEALVVSQFTLYGDCRKGRRPGYSDAAPPELANELYERFKEALSGFPIPVKSGIFQAMMVVSIENDGPVTILLDTKKAF